MHTLSCSVCAFVFQPGMQILSIDDVSLKQVSHQEAINIIRIAFKDRSMPVMKLRALP